MLPNFDQLVLLIYFINSFFKLRMAAMTVPGSLRLLELRLQIKVNNKYLLKHLRISWIVYIYS